MGILDNLGSDTKKIFLAGLGAVSSTADKGREIVNKLVSKGELTVEEGKRLNSELSCKVQESGQNFKGALLAKYMKSMSKGQRKEFVKKVSQLSDQLDKEEDDLGKDGETPRQNGDSGKCCSDEK